MHNIPGLDQKIFDGLCEMALKTYEKDKRHHTIFFYFCSKGMAIMPVLIEIDDEVYASLKTHLREQGATSYVLINEAWLQQCNPLRMPKMQPKDDPMSIEVLSVAGVFPDGQKLIRSWEVDRGKIITERPAAPDVGGRFMAMLEP